MKLLKVVFLFVLMSAFTSLALSQEIVKFDGKEWSRQQNRKNFARIFSGQPEQAIANMNRYLKEHGADAEVLFGLCVANYMQNKPENGFDYFEKALIAGLPVERFMAGPGNILKPLYKTEKFQQLTTGKKLIHGPMLGSVTERTANIWIRTFQPVSFAVTIAEDVGLEEIVGIFKSATLAANDFTGIVFINNLNPQSTYFYSLKVEGKTVPGVWKFKTFPSPNSAGQVRVAFGGGSSYNPQFERIWAAIKKSKPDAFLAMGDNVYIDSPELPDVQKYCYYQRQSSPPFRELVSSLPVFSVWDDHDFGVNDSFGGAEKFKPAWKTAVLKVFKENYVNPAYGGGNKQPGIYYDFSIGDAAFFMLDTRYYRTPSHIDKSKNAAGPNMLGNAQMHWLKNRLKQSRAIFKVIVSSVPWSDGAKDAMEGRFDTWRGYPQERKEIFDFLSENEISGVLLLSADRHRHDAWKHERPGDYPLYEFTSSRLTNIHYHSLRSGALFGYNEKRGFGLLEFNTAAGQPYVVFKIITIDNELIDQVRIYLHQLTSVK